MTAANFVSDSGDYIGQGESYSFPTVTYDGLRGGYPTFSVSNATDQLTSGSPRLPAKPSPPEPTMVLSDSFPISGIARTRRIWGREGMQHRCGQFHRL